MGTLLGILVFYLLPLFVCLFIGWLKLPKNSTVQDFRDIFDGGLYPPFPWLFVPIANVFLAATVVFIGFYDLLNNLDIRIK